MKALFISDGNTQDYQCDMVMHGGRSVLGTDFIDMNKAWYMYQGRESELKDTYGRGFTMYGHLEDIEIDRSNIQEKIKDKYFDVIIYGSIRRNMTYIEDVLTYYDKKSIVFIDGEDHNNISELSVKGTYYKRELDKATSNVYPIGFSIPEHLIVNSIPDKNKIMSSIIPNSGFNYGYDNQEDYYNEYRKSYFAITHKKAGWDCLRHYEILLNGCIPEFKDLKDCPKLTMVNFPKKILSECNSIFMKDNEHIRNIDNYSDCCNRLLEHTRSELTTKRMFNRILNNIN